jgi:hypothetical protein
MHSLLASSIYSEVLTFTDQFMVLLFTATGAPLAARQI